MQFRRGTGARHPTPSSTQGNRYERFNRTERRPRQPRQSHEIKQFLDDHPGLHKKALSDIRRIDKMDDDKRDDYFRSFDKLRETLSGNWEGQKTPDMFVDGENVSEPEDGDAIPAFGDDADEFPA